jgi:hypothetical protein
MPVVEKLTSERGRWRSTTGLLAPLPPLGAHSPVEHDDVLRRGGATCVRGCACRPREGGGECEGEGAAEAGSGVAALL